MPILLYYYCENNKCILHLLFREPYKAKAYNLINKLTTTWERQQISSFCYTWYLTHSLIRLSLKVIPKAPFNNSIILPRFTQPFYAHGLTNQVP